MAVSIPTNDIAAAGQIGSTLDRANDLLIAAYTTPETDQNSIDALVKSLGLEPMTGTYTDKDGTTKNKQWTLEGVQQAAQRLYDRAVSSYTALTNLLRSKKQALDSVIQNIR